MRRIHNCLIETGRNEYVAIAPDVGNKFTADECRAAVGGKYRIYHLNDGRLLLVNENGVLDPLPCNEFATYLVVRIGTRETLDIIYGPALILEPESFP